MELSIKRQRERESPIKGALGNLGKHAFFSAPIQSIFFAQDLLGLEQCEKSDVSRPGKIQIWTESMSESQGPAREEKLPALH